MKAKYLILVLLVSLMLLPVSPANSIHAAGALAPAACKWNWAPIDAPSHPGPGLANRVAVRNANDVWVAGSNLWHWDGADWNVARKGKGSGFQDVVTLGAKRVYVLSKEVMLWNGKKWKPLGKLPPLEGAILSALAVVAKNNIWVSATLLDNSTQMLHWNGKRWKRFGEPIAGHINDMDVVGANNIWAGGNNLYHWDGSIWQTSLLGDANDEFQRIQSGPTGALWAVGSRRFYNGHTMQSVPLAFRWDGESWSELEYDSVSDDLFTGVLPVSENDVWLTTDLALWHWDGFAFTPVPAGPSTRASLEFGGVGLDETDRFWIIGNYYGGSAWAQHGNGETWQDDVLPEPKVLANTQFQSAAAPASDDVWIAGSFSNWIAADGYSQEFAMLAHWNGTEWSFADLDHEPGQLVDISAASPDDIWAVGTLDFYGSYFLHYDGVEWQHIQGSMGLDVSLNAVATLSQNDAWAVGSFYRRDAPTPFHEVHIMHWDGTAWSVSPTPSVGGPQAMLYDVYALSPNDVWAVGNRLDEEYRSTTLVLRWDGYVWSIFESPNPGDFNGLSNIAFLAPGEIWATGGATRNDETSMLLAHWTGQEWETLLDNSIYRMTSLAALAPKSLWGTGVAMGSGKPIVARWNGKRWRTFWAAQTKPNLEGITVLSENEIWAVGYGDAVPLVVRGLCKQDD